MHEPTQPEGGPRATFRGLYIDQGRNISLKEEPLPPLGDDQVRIRTEFASIKHGTEFHNLSADSPFDSERYDSGLQLFVPRPEAERGAFFAAGFAGNTAVGTVTQVGSAVTAFRPGDRVYGYAPVCDVLTRQENQIHLLTPPLTEKDAVCIDPALYAYAAVRDARLCLGDNAVVFGLGAIGLLTVQMLRQGGCLNIIAVDPLEKRRELARRFGAGLALDPAACDVAIETRRYLGGPGADFAIEASGNYKALRDALRSVQRSGRVVTLGYYKGRGTELELAKEWMHNRLEMISSMPTWGNPPREYPVWTEARLYRAVEEMFRRNFLQSEDLLDPVVDFADSARAFREIFENPSQAIKLGIRFPH